MKAFRGKTALVTGAGSGIGRAFAIHLAEAGANVIATDVSAERLAALNAELRGTLERLGNRCETALLDVSDADAFASVVAQHGPIDVLVNNAGVGLAGEIQEMKIADWRRVIDVNTMGVIHGIDAVYRSMVERGTGHIINVASGAGLLPRPGMVPYATSKAAVLGLSLSLQPEAAAHGVHVSVACPGYIATDIMAATDYRGVDGAGLQSEIPLKPMSAADCASQILRGAARGKTLIPVTFPTRLEWWLSRLSPVLVLKIARVRAKTFRKHRSR